MDNQKNSAGSLITITLIFGLAYAVLRYHRIHYQPPGERIMQPRIPHHVSRIPHQRRKI
jgi:hypothetical protein